jgi:hypothetical protein
VLGEAGRDRDLGAHRALVVADPLGDVRGEGLGLEGLAQDHLVDRLVDDLLEARHVRALLLRAQVDETLDLGVEELLGAVRLDAQDLLHPGHPHPREAYVGGGTACLDVLAEQGVRLGHRNPR